MKRYAFSLVLSSLLFFSFISPAFAANTLIVNPNQKLQTVPDDFLGVSLGTGIFRCREIALLNANPVYRNLYKNLSPGVIRFGGSNQVSLYWAPNLVNCDLVKDASGKVHYGKKLVDDTKKILDILNWKVIWGMNNVDPAARPAEEASYIKSALGSRLVAIAPSNEGGGASASAWQTFLNTILPSAPDIPVSGPSQSAISKTFAPEANQFLDIFHANLKYATFHYYTSLNAACATAPSTTQLLDSKFIDNMYINRIDPFIAKAKSYGLPVLMDEGSTYPCGGVVGVSDIYASTLWGIDFLFTSLSHGVTGVNLHGGVESIYGPIGGSYANEVTAFPKPLYYAMLLFKQGAANGNLVSSTLSTTQNIRAWSVVGSDGKLRVIILNKESTPVNVDINTTNFYNSRNVLRLNAPSLTSQVISATNNPINLGGGPVSPNGTWTPKSLPVTAVNGNTTTVTVPAIGASVFTFSQEPFVSPNPGDINKDGKVDLTDINLVKTGFGKPYTIYDYNNIVSNYGK